MIEPKLDPGDVRRAIKALNEIDKGLVKELRSKLKTSLLPIGNQIKMAVPINPPLSGFRHKGPTAWSKTAAKVSFTPGRSKKFKKGNPLVSIRIDPGKLRRGIYIAELAGSRSSGSTAQGRNLISVLNQRQPMKQRGGRYAYSNFRMRRPEIVKIAVRILNVYLNKVDRKI